MEIQGKYLCNIRKDKLHLEKLIINIEKTFNLSNVDINYNSQYKESEKDMYNKITAFMEDLKEFNNDDDVILIVSHYGWLNRFFQINTGKGYEFINSEVKIIEI